MDNSRAKAFDAPIKPAHILSEENCSERSCVRRFANVQLLRGRQHVPAGIMLSGAWRARISRAQNQAHGLWLIKWPEVSPPGSSTRNTVSRKCEDQAAVARGWAGRSRKGRGLQPSVRFLFQVRARPHPQVFAGSRGHRERHYMCWGWRVGAQHQQNLPSRSSATETQARVRRGSLFI